MSIAPGESSNLPLHQKNFFLIGLSFDWNSIERTVIADARAIMNAGGNVHLYTFRDSHLDRQAKKWKIICHYHQGAVATKIFKWNKLKAVAKLIRNNQIDLVHCYDIKILWPLCYFLRADSLTPLVLTLSKELEL